MNLDAVTDEGALATRAAAGDVAAFGGLVRLHQSKLRGFLLRLTGGRHALADDLAQETFLEAYKKIAQFRREGPFSAWLYRIAYSRFLMHLRRRKEEQLENTQAPMPSISPNETGMDLERAMARISAEERAALTLCFALGYSHSEAADILDMPVGTVKSHIARGREKLRALLGADDGVLNA